MSVRNPLQIGLTIYVNQRPALLWPVIDSVSMSALTFAQIVTSVLEHQRLGSIKGTLHTELKQAGKFAKETALTMPWFHRAPLKSCCESVADCVSLNPYW